jgi:hypothetical protein
LNVKVFGQLGFSGSTFIAIETLDNLAVHKADRSR